MSTAKRNAFPLLVLAACALHVVLFIAAGPGFNSSDDEVYTRLAHSMSVGDFELSPEHRGNRLGLIAPTAAIYAAVGVGRWSTVIWPLLCSLTGIVAVAGITRRLAGDDRAGAVAAFLFAPLTIVLGGSVFLMPDSPVGVMMLLAAACLWVARDLDRRRAVAWGAASAFFIAAGVLTKLTALWLAPFFAALFAADVLRRRRGAAWSGFVLTGVVAALVFFAAYAHFTGDALYRVHAVSAQHNDTHWAYADASTGELLRRLTYQPGLMWARALPEMMFLLALALAVPLSLRGESRRSRDIAYWSAYAVVVIGGFWIGTTSFARLAPLPLLPRMLAPAAAPLAIVAATALVSERPTARRVLPSVALMCAGLIIVALDGRILVAGMYAAMATIAFLALRAPHRARGWTVIAALTVSVLLSGYSIVRRGAGESKGMRVERLAMSTLDALTSADATVLTDRRSERTFRFYRGYQPGAPTVLPWDDLASPPPQTRPLYVYWHAERIAWRGGRAAPPTWLAELTESGEVVWESDDARLVRLAPR